MRSSSHTMLHLGLVLILLGVLVSSNTQFTEQGWYTVGSSIDLGSVTVELDDITVDYTNPHSYAIIGTILVFENGVLAGTGDTIAAVEPGWGSHYSVLITGNLWRDVYISLHNIRLDPITRAISQAYLEVKVIQLVSLVWVGCLITLIAMFIMLMVYSTRFATGSTNS